MDGPDELLIIVEAAMWSSEEQSAKPSRTLALFFRSLCTVKGRSAPNGGLPTLKLSSNPWVELPEILPLGPVNVGLDKQQPVTVWLRLMMRNGCGFGDWGSRSPMFGETEHLDAIS